MVAVPGHANPADYDALRDLAAEIGGYYVARQRAATDQAAQASWLRLALELDDEVRAIDPFNGTQVEVGRQRLRQRRREIRLADLGPQRA